MKDANGRPIELGDTVATPWPKPETAEEVARLPQAIKGAILGKVIEVFTETVGYLIVDRDGNTIQSTVDLTEATNLLNLYRPLCGAEGLRMERVYVHLGDGITYRASEIVSLSGLKWVTCVECHFTWPFDSRMNEQQECPDCGALLFFEENKCHA